MRPPLIQLLLTNINSPNGDEFEAEASSDLDIAEGDVVTFESDTYSRRELPADPVITRIRRDISWENVIADYLADIPQQNVLNSNILNILSSH